MNKLVKLQGNTVLIVDQASGDIDETISLQFFSYEFGLEIVHFIDSNKTQTVYTIALDSLLDDVGGALDTYQLALDYLSTFAMPGGSVTLAPGSEVQIVDDVNNPIATGNGTSDATAKGLIIMGEDQAGNLVRIRTTTDGRLISSASVTNPPSTTPVNKIYLSSLSGSQDDDYIIPNGVGLVIQAVNCGAEDDVDGSKVELWYYTDATKTTGQLLSALYINGSNGRDEINQMFTGDGSGIITLRRERLGGGSSEIFGKWQGYY